MTPLSAHTLSRAAFRAARTEDRKLRKDPFLEVLALKVPFGALCWKLLCFSRFPNEVPWPGRLRGYTPSQILDAGQRRELQTIRPASHTTALGGLFIADEREELQGGNYKAAELTGLIRPS